MLKTIVDRIFNNVLHSLIHSKDKPKQTLTCHLHIRSIHGKNFMNFSEVDLWCIQMISSLLCIPTATYAPKQKFFLKRYHAYKCWPLLTLYDLDLLNSRHYLTLDQWRFDMYAKKKKRRYFHIKLPALYVWNSVNSTWSIQTAVLNRSEMTYDLHKNNWHYFVKEG